MTMEHHMVMTSDGCLKTAVTIFIASASDDAERHIHSALEK